MSIVRLRPVALVLGLLLTGFTASAQDSPGRTRVGELVPTAVSSPHPYERGEQVWEIHHPGATYVKVYFSRFELAPGDRLEIASPDGSERYFFTGKGYKNKGENFWGNSVLGDTVILRLQSIAGGAYGFDIGEVAIGNVPIVPPPSSASVCGANDWRDIECYRDDYPTELDRARRAVVVLFNGVENCSGVKIGCPNQFLTNEHCVTSQGEVDVTELRFEYKNADCGGGGSSFSQSYLGDQFITDDFTLDYSVITALGASDDYEAAEFDPRLPEVGERIYITGHPAGNPMKLSLEDSGSGTGLCQVDVSPQNGRGTDTDIGYFCDTTGGSSGSPVWSGDSHKLIALHHFGGCANGGVRIDLIYPQIEDLIASCCDAVPAAPALTTQVIEDNVVDLTWNDSDQPGVIEYNVLRSRLDGGPYSKIATIDDTSPGVADGPGYVFQDHDVSGGTTYYYVVEATDGATCTSELSLESDATATGACTLAPIFGGAIAVNAPELNLCTLEVFWNGATPECGSAVSYNVYRSTTPDFEPGAANQVASGVTGTNFVDVDQLVDGTTYFYKVRAVDGDNGSEDANSSQHFATPVGFNGGTCTTGSSCEDNPFVDVKPEGPLTVCQNGAPELSAELTGGNGPFVYQWVADGVPIPGADQSTYWPVDLGDHAYNVLVKSDSCPNQVFDGQDTLLTQVATPYFDGLVSAVNPQNATCTVDLDWEPATTPCSGPISYYVYRDTTSPVLPEAANLVAAGVAATEWSDELLLANGDTYHYLVRAYDSSTGHFDANSVQLSATPDGPGNGPGSDLFADFVDAPAFGEWTVTTGPGNHRCGEWALTGDAGRRPSGGSGNFAGADSTCDGQLLPLTSSTLYSPTVDLTDANILSVTFEADVRYDTANGDDAKIDVWDGSSWVTVWTDPNGAFNQQVSFDVSAEAIGNPAFQVRFDYQNANADRFFSVDDVDIIVDRFAPCSTAAVGPASVPQTSLLASLDGGSIDLSWDAASCPANDYQLIYGDLATVGSWAIDGSACALGTSGDFDWSGVPAGDLWYLVVGTDGAGTESSWGVSSLFLERNGGAASGECASSAKDATNVCR